MLIPINVFGASYLPVQGSTTFEQGLAVSVDSSGYAVKATTGTPEKILGLSADRNRAQEAYEWVNRLAESGNETAPSGMLTYYHNGGEFYIDVDDSAITTPQGTAIGGVVVANSTKTAGTLLYPAANGQLTSTKTGSDTAVAIILENSGAIDSGIPGEYEPGSSVNYAVDGTSRTWVKIKLLV